LLAENEVLAVFLVGVQLLLSIDVKHSGYV